MSKIYFILLRRKIPLYLILDKEKVLQESKTLEGAHDVKLEFDECANDQPSMVLDIQQLDDLEKIDTIVLYVAEERQSHP